MLSKHDFDRDKPTPIELIDMNAADPVRIFIKNEPHKLSKLAIDNLRIIGSMTIVDEIVARILFGRQNTTDITHWMDIPSKPGIGLSSDQQMHDFVKKSNLERKWKYSDQTEFDWRHKPWIFEYELQIRERLCKPPPLWSRIARNHYYCIMNKLFVTSDGSIYQQKIPGVMPSGWYNTSSTNSRIRFLLAKIIKALDAQTMGDDCMEETEMLAEEAQRAYAELGYILKNFETEPEFCSHILSNEYPYATPTDSSFFKSLFRLLSNKSAHDFVERIDQFYYEYRHSPHLSRFGSLLQRAREEARKLNEENRQENQEDRECCEEG